MINYNNIHQAIAALNQCARENAKTFNGIWSIRVSELCSDVSKFLSKVQEDRVKLKEKQCNKERINDETYDALKRLGIFDTSVRSYNRGDSDYSRHTIQPWAIWQDYHLNPWDADIVKRVLRTKKSDSRRLDYEKIIHICQERIRQIDNGYNEKRLKQLNKDDANRIH